MGTNRGRRCGISYVWCMMIIMFILTTILIWDRFTYNIYPMYLTLSSPIIADDWTATTYFIIGWVAGRELLISSAFMYLLQCKCLFNYLFEHKPRWLLVDDILISNKKLHYYFGWTIITIPMLVHCWSAFLPLIKYPTNSLNIYYDQWMRPIDDETDFYVEVYHHKHINVALSDIYMLVIVTIIFCVIFPLANNKSLNQRNWTLAQYLHLVAATLYTIELLRTPFTCHAWLICAPFIVLYIIDRIIGLKYYRTTNAAKLICKYNIDKDYIVLFLHIPNLPNKKQSKNDEYIKYLGDIYWFNKQHHGGDFAHPFTTFFNHGEADRNDIMAQSLLFSASMRDLISHKKHKFPIRPAISTEQHLNYDKNINYDMYRTETADTAQAHKQCSDDNDDSNDSMSKNDNDSLSEKQKKDNLRDPNLWVDAKAEKQYKWNVGVIIRVHHKKKSGGGNDKKMTFTEYCADELGYNYDDYTDYGGKNESVNLLSYGPYRSSFSHVIDEILVNNNKYSPYPVVLIGTGAGCSYILDFLFYIRSQNIKSFKSRVDIHFSCRSIKLFQWITDLLCKKKESNLFINAHLTSHDNIAQYDDNVLPYDKNKRKARCGRASFESVLRNSIVDTKVFFCGSPFIQKKLVTICKELNFKLYQSSAFA